MLWLALWNETQRYPPLSDRVLDLIPRIDWIARHNYHLWIFLYVPIALLLWRVDRARFVRLHYVSGALSLLRGICILATGLGPVDGLGGTTLAPDQVGAAWWHLVNPFTVFSGNALHVSLTQDLFFSGHTSSTFALVLFAWSANRRLGYAAFFAHVFVVATVFLSHLHYTIDVIGAWAVTFCVFAIAEWRTGLLRFCAGK